MTGGVVVADCDCAGTILLPSKKKKVNLKYKVWDSLFLTVGVGMIGKKLDITLKSSYSLIIKQMRER